VKTWISAFVGVGELDSSVQYDFKVDLGASLSMASTNVLSVPVLVFLLGVISVRLKADLRLPDPVYQATAIYLLFAIGLKGGVALRASEPADVLLPIVVAIALGIVIPIAVFLVLKWVTRLNAIDRGAMAAHYGSTSLVTFTAALVFLDALDVSYEGFMPTLLTVLEIPGIVVGLLLAKRYASTRSRVEDATSRDQVSRDSVSRDSVSRDWIREVVLGKSVLILFGGLVIGFLTGVQGYEQVEPFFGGLFTGVLALFLLEMGVLAGRRLSDIRTAGPGLIIFAIVFPVFAGTLGIISGYLAGLSMGGAMILGVLCASASYIAAPAAVRLALPEANPGITLTSSLGITFPFNLIVGIPIYYLVAQALESWFL
jgi:hypothetical protein